MGPGSGLIIVNLTTTNKEEATMATKKATQIDELRNALAHLLDATLGLDAPHIQRARDEAAAILDKAAGFDVAKWSTLCSYIAPSGANFDKLPKILAVALHAAVWKRQDGYGAPGFTPAQGWDFSGIRDSSRAAKTRILEAAEELVPGIF